MPSALYVLGRTVLDGCELVRLLAPGSALGAEWPGAGCRAAPRTACPQQGRHRSRRRVPGGCSRPRRAAWRGGAGSGANYRVACAEAATRWRSRYIT